jgi:hypothetical protein
VSVTEGQQTAVVSVDTSRISRERQPCRCDFIAGRSRTGVFGRASRSGGLGGWVILGGPRSEMVSGRHGYLIMVATLLAACVPAPKPDSQSTDQTTTQTQTAQTPVPVVQEPETGPEPADDSDSCVASIFRTRRQRQTASPGRRALADSPWIPRTFIIRPHATGGAAPLW